jgi:CNT family concentrative nucleoside transporter
VQRRESLNVAASIFMGQTEAPLTIRPYLAEMTESELMTVMTSGMAHISGGSWRLHPLRIEAKHLLTAVIMTAPGTIMMAKMLVGNRGAQDDGRGEARGRDHRRQRHRRRRPRTGEGLQLALNVGAMLISFLALIAMVNYILGLAHLSLQQIFGWVFAPVAWSMGVPWRDAPTIGNLLGTRMALNEFVAYSQLGPLKGTIDRSRSRLRRSRCAGSPTSARSASRSAASARSPRTGATTSPGSACGRCSPARWPTS